MTPHLSLIYTSPPISKFYHGRFSKTGAAFGKDIEGFALEALERIAELPTIRELFADVRGQIQESGISDEELGAKIDDAIDEVRKGRRA